MKQKASEKIYSKLQVKRLLLVIKKELENRVETFEVDLRNGERIRIKAIAQYRMDGVLYEALKQVKGEPFN